MLLRSVLLNPTLLTVAVVYGLLLAIAQTAGLFGIWLGVLVLLSVWRFCYAVLRVVAQGRTSAPPGIDTMNPVSELPLVLHFLIFPGVAAWYEITMALGPGRSFANLGIVVGLFLLAVFPASAGLMAITGNVLLALSPRRIVGFARAVGIRYLTLPAAVIAVWFARGILQGLVDRMVIGSLWLTWAATTWGLLALFGLIGATIFARRGVFDIPGLAEGKSERQTRWSREDKFSGWRRVLDTVYGNWRSGQQQEAVAELRKLVAKEQHSFDVFAWLFEETLIWEDKRCALHVARGFVHRLLKDANEADALEVVLRCRGFSQQPRLVPGDAARLAEYARGNGQLGLADEIASWEVDTEAPGG